MRIHGPKIWKKIFVLRNVRRHFCSSGYERQVAVQIAHSYQPVQELFTHNRYCSLYLCKLNISRFISHTFYANVTSQNPTSLLSTKLVETMNGLQQSLVQMASVIFFVSNFKLLLTKNINMTFVPDNEHKNGRIISK